MGLSDNLIRERFEANVHIVPFSTCHYWGGAVNDAGYGMLHLDGKWTRAHRVSYELQGANSRALIAKLHGTTIQTVSDIKRGATYAGVTGHGGS